MHIIFLKFAAFSEFRKVTLGGLKLRQSIFLLLLGRVFMTHATKAIYRWMLSDYVKVSNLSTEQMLYTERDIEESMDRIETINFHQEMDVGGVKFWSYHAGHVLGAAMFMIEIAGVKVCVLVL